MRVSSILIGADKTEKINQNFFHLLCSLKELVGNLESGNLFFENGYWDNNKKWVEGASIQVTLISDEDLEEIQDVAHSYNVTRLEYVFFVETENEALS